MHMIKLDISDDFYRIGLNIDDIPKLGVVFPMLPGDKPLITFPLVLPMVWMNSLPIFLTATKSIRAALRKLENFCALCTLACSDSLFSKI